MPKLRAAQQLSKMLLGDAAIKQLEIAGKPQTAVQIWNGLSASGFRTGVKDPVHAVHCSLRRRSLKNPRLQFADDQWSLKPFEPKKGYSCRDREAQIDRIKAGIVQFRAKSGGRWGRRQITAEQIRRFRELYDSGAYSVHKATRTAGMSNAYFYLHREKILLWTNGEPWPPRGRG